jgi:putative flippase GtrA
MTKGFTQVYAQFRRFLLVGAAATAIQYALLVLLVHLFQVPPVLASGIGFTTSGVYSYLRNRSYTFRSDADHANIAPRFVTVTLLGLGWNLALMQLLSGILHWPYLLAQVLTSGVVLVWNFAGNAWWTFATKKA